MKRYWPWILCAPLLFPVLLAGVLLAPLLLLICLPFWLWVIVRDRRESSRAVTWETRAARAEPDVTQTATSIAPGNASPLPGGHEGVNMRQPAQPAVGTPVPEQQPASPQQEPYLETFTDFQRDLAVFAQRETHWPFHSAITAEQCAKWFDLAQQYQHEVRQIARLRRPEREVEE